MDANNNQKKDNKKSITLIPLDWKNYERRRSFMRSHGSVAKQGWKTKIDFADRRYTDAPVSGEEIASLIRKSKTDLVAIIDEEIPCDAYLFSWLADFSNESEVHCAYQRMRASKSGSNLFLAIYSFLVRILLRIGKNKYRPGIAVFFRNQNAIDWIPQSDEFTLTEFLALARVDGQKIRETLISPRSQPKNPIRSRAVLSDIGQTVRFWWNRIMFPGSQWVTNDGDKTGPTKRVKLSRRQKALASLALGVLTVVVLSTNLGFPLFESEDASNVQLAVNILETGEWNSLTLSGQPSWNHPPLVAWAMAVSFKQFGINEFAARLPGTVAAILTILISFAIGRRLLGFRAALIGALLMLSSVGIVFSGRFITADTTITLCSTITLLAGYLALFKNQFSMKWWLVAAIACGVGILTSGPSILVLSLSPLILASWLYGTNDLVKPRNWFWFAMPVVLVAGPWIGAMGWVHPEFLYHFFCEQTVLGFVDSFNHQAPFWYYLPVIALGMFPTSCLLPALVRKATVRDRITRSQRTREVGFLILCAIWFVGFFSLSPSKTTSDILPAYPFVCLSLGWMLETMIFSMSSEQFSALRLEQAAKNIGLSLIAATIGVQMVLLLYFRQSSAFVFFTIVVPLMLLALARLAFYRKSSPKAAWIGLAIVAITFNVYFVDRLLPIVSESRSIQRAALTLQNDPNFADAKVIFFGEDEFGATLQLDEQNLVSFKPEEMDSICEFLYRHPQAIVISSEAAIKNLRGALDSSIEIEKLPQHRRLYTSRIGQVRSASRETRQHGKTTSAH